MFHQSLSHCARCTLKLPAITTSQHRFLLQSASMMRQYKRTHYEVLGLPPSATQTEIRDAFVKLSKETHPDMNPDDPHNHVKFVQLNEAYTTLSKLHSRKAYDLSLAYMSRSAASSHTVGPMYSPGTGVRTDFHDGNQQNERVFWDETIWEMRDKSKDKHAFYPPDSYYGIKGIPKQSNGVVAAVICISIATLSVAHFIFGIMWSKKKSRETVEKIDRKNLRILKEVEERARINGSAKQLELLRLKVAEFEAAKAKARLARTSDS